METQKITIELPSEILSLVAARKKDIPSRILEYLILELYRIGEISSGKAAQCLGMERSEFIRFASRLGIPFINMDRDELTEDVEHARRVSEEAGK
jgi:predicted HTH domain antitoxin